MRPLWHPLSALLLDDPPAYATPTMLRMLLGAGALSLRYGGDRMWPAVRHGQRLRIEKPVGAPRRGEVVVVCPDGIPDLLRVQRIESGRLRLGADADPGARWSLEAEQVLARAALMGKRPTPAGRLLRRLLLELIEAWHGHPDRDLDPARTVRDKYEAQAPFYAGRQEAGLTDALRSRIRASFPAGAPLLVIGSGAGRECFDLVAEGHPVTGIDFAPSMVRVARDRAARRGLRVEFVEGDVRACSFPPASFGGALFTYDVYSFVPRRRRRLQLLTRLRSWLRADGAVLLSARQVRSPWERALLTVQWLAARRAPRGREWGDSHTRWVDASGRLRRSYVHLFSERQIRREARSAGFLCDEWQGGHLLLRPAPPGRLLP